MTAVVAAAVAAACQGAKKGNDTAAVNAPAAGASAADSSVVPAPGSAPSAAATSGAPNGAAKPATAASQTSMGTATTGRPKTPATPTERISVDTSPRPGNQPPAGATTPALVIFRDSVGKADLDWLRGQGLAIVNVNEAAHAVSVAVPEGYHGNPKANPRVLRFTIAMR